MLLNNQLNEIIRKGIDDKLSVKRVTIFVNSEKLDSIKKEEARKKSELVNSGKNKAGNKRHYNRNENWKIEKKNIFLLLRDFKLTFYAKMKMPDFTTVPLKP